MDVPRSNGQHVDRAEKPPYTESAVTFKKPVAPCSLVVSAPRHLTRSIEPGILMLAFDGVTLAGRDPLSNPLTMTGLTRGLRGEMEITSSKCNFVTTKASEIRCLEI